LEFLEVRLRAHASALSALGEFYGDRLALDRLGPACYQAGATRLDFVPGDEEAFYHFALLVPGDRFDALLEWAAERVELLHRATGEVVFDFEFWGALACYFHDPAGNIVELIAHRGLGETGAGGPFAGAELLGLSELGLVGEPPAMAAALEGRLGLELWSGTVEGEGSLGFVGVKGRTLILSPPGRGWLPTGRPAEAHPVDVTLSGPPRGQALLEGSRHRVRRV
jgi:hypothetical protein